MPRKKEHIRQIFFIAVFLLTIGSLFIRNQFSDTEENIITKREEVEINESKKDFNKEFIVKNYENCIHRIRGNKDLIAMYELNSIDINNYCKCLSKKNVDNHKIVNGDFQGLREELKIDYGIECMEELNFFKRINPYTNPNRSNYKHVLSNKLVTIENRMKWSPIFMNTVFENCSLFKEKLKVSDREIETICKCVVTKLTNEFTFEQFGKMNEISLNMVINNCKHN